MHMGSGHFSLNFTGGGCMWDYKCCPHVRCKPELDTSCRSLCAEVRARWWHPYPVTCDVIRTVPVTCMLDPSNTASPHPKTKRSISNRWEGVSHGHSPAVCCMCERATPGRCPHTWVFIRENSFLRTAIHFKTSGRPRSLLGTRPPFDNHWHPNRADDNISCPTQFTSSSKLSDAPCPPLSFQGHPPYSHDCIH